MYTKGGWVNVPGPGWVGGRLSICTLREGWVNVPGARVGGWAAEYLHT